MYEKEQQRKNFKYLNIKASLRLSRWVFYSVQLVVIYSQQLRYVSLKLFLSLLITTNLSVRVVFEWSRHM